MSNPERRPELLRETIRTQNKIISELCEEMAYLRVLLKKCQPYVEGGPTCDPELCDSVEKEVGDG